MKKLCCVIVFGALLLCSMNVYADGSFSGYTFGDYYNFSKNHDSDLEGQNGFWLRRIYFTYN